MIGIKDEKETSLKGMEKNFYFINSTNQDRHVGRIFK